MSVIQFYYQAVASLWISGSFLQTEENFKRLHVIELIVTNFYCHYHGLMTYSIAAGFVNSHKLVSAA